MLKPFHGTGLFLYSLKDIKKSEVSRSFKEHVVWNRLRWIFSNLLLLILLLILVTEDILHLWNFLQNEYVIFPCSIFMTNLSPTFLIKIISLFLTPLAFSFVHNVVVYKALLLYEKSDNLVNKIFIVNVLSMYLSTTWRLWSFQRSWINIS